jgi:hypothetical protein
MSVDAAPVAQATSSVSPAEPIRLTLCRPLPPDAAGDAAPLMSAAGVSIEPAAVAETSGTDEDADAAIKSDFNAFVERLIPYLGAEVAAHPLDMWKQRYEPAIRSLEVSRTRNPIYPYSGFFSLQKRWQSAIKVGDKSYESTATTLDTLVFLYRDGTWEFTSGRSTGNMKVRMPGAGALVNPIDSELGGDERIRRATLAANGAAAVARSARK